jgi:hypothetical protein
VKKTEANSIKRETMLRRFFFLIAALIAWQVSSADAQTEIDTTLTMPEGESVTFWVQIPADYSPEHPPAILIWWHQYGGSEYEMRDYTDFDVEAAHRGWIAACHAGPNYHHYNGAVAQWHCRIMLDWLSAHYPFSRDSIYMIGGSMGGAAPQIWNNNNCGSDDYLIAAAGCGSPILDCQLRQEQYLAAGEPNHAMDTLFGGLPEDGDSVRFEYHRYSAVFLADTSRSMHYNSLHLPVWCSWGNTDAERYAYGIAAHALDSLRRALGADTTLTFESPIAGHGLEIMWPEGVCNWLSGFSAYRYPDDVQISADNSGSYYWTDATLAHEDTVFGRYRATKNFAQRRIDVSILRNVSTLAVNFEFPWARFDSLRANFAMLESNTSIVQIILEGTPEPQDIRQVSGDPIGYEYTNNRSIITFHGTVAVDIVFPRDAVNAPIPLVPTTTRLVNAYPNPFNATASLEIESSRAQSRELVVYDILGRIAMRLSIRLVPGLQRVALNADGLGSGTYFASLNNSGQILRLSLIK